ncbi:MAG: hypothetical protein JSR17_02045 [Proteobacteria bacterium]|nr:hypothetical protein [Pseudomonadota bacterium]
MAAPDNASSSKGEKHGILYFIKKLFHRHSQAEKQRTVSQDEYHLEPKYWPEVIDFINNLNQLIETHTIDDTNIKHINQRIVDYVVDQINVKGSVVDIEQRYSGLNTLADRMLSSTFNKIVGLKHESTTHADFSEAVSNFKKRLAVRHQNEIAYYQSHPSSTPH